MKTVLHVGCGRKRLPQMPKGFQDGTWREVRLDIAPQVEPDIIGTITDMSAVAAGSMDALFSSHNIEHVYPHEVPAALGEFHRVLAPSGFVLITCPDLQALGRLVSQGRLTDALYTSPSGPITPLDILFGHRASVAAGSEYMAHRGGFSVTTLRAAVEAAGFPLVRGVRRPANYDIWVLGAREGVEEAEFKDLAARFLPRPPGRAASGSLASGGLRSPLRPSRVVVRRAPFTAPAPEGSG